MISRRELLRAIALGGGIVAGELWVPGARKMFLPSRRILTRDEIAKEAIRRLSRMDLQSWATAISRSRLDAMATGSGAILAEYSPTNNAVNYKAVTLRI